MKELPELIAGEKSEPRRRMLSRLYWYNLLHSGDYKKLVVLLADPRDPRSIEATDAYACACRLWLREKFLERNDSPVRINLQGEREQKPDSPVRTTMRDDLERMLDGLSTYETVQARKLGINTS